MAFEDFEESVEQGEPVQLFLFRYGSDPSEYYAYTDYTHDIEVAERATGALAFGLVIAAFVAVGAAVTVYDIGKWLAIW